MLTLGGFMEGTCAENGYSTYVVGNIQFPMENCDVLYADVYSENTGNDFLPMDFYPPFHLKIALEWHLMFLRWYFNPQI